MGPVGWLVSFGAVAGISVLLARSPRFRSWVIEIVTRIVRPEAAGVLQRTELAVRRELKADTHATLGGVCVGPSGVAIYAPAKLFAILRAAKPELRRSLYEWLRDELDARVPASFEVLVFETSPTGEVRVETWHEGDRRPGPVRASQPREPWAGPGDVTGEDTVLEASAGQDTVVETEGSQPWVVLRWSDGRVERVEGAQLRIGRSPEMDVTVDDPRVSRHHATLTLGLEQSWAEIAEGVTNQLRIDGVRAVPGMQVPIHAGTRLELSRSCVLVVEDLSVGVAP